MDPWYFTVRAKREQLIMRGSIKGNNNQAGKDALIEEEKVEKGNVSLLVVPTIYIQRFFTIHKTLDQAD